MGIDLDKAKTVLLVGRTKVLLNAGYSIPEIAEKLKVSEDKIHEFKEKIDKAQANN